MTTLRNIFYRLPPGSRIFARKLFYWTSYFSKREKYPNGLPLPPKSLIFTGGGDFQKTGFKFLDIFRKHQLLEPNDTVLDIGSGIGRLASPLTTYLSKDGNYIGIDIMQLGVKWCQKNISPRFPNFEFRFIDLKNDLYRNEGREATDLQFPFEDNTFDFVFLISVFTHMLPLEVENYFGEISRTLKKGKSCFMSLFLFKNAQILNINSFGKFIIQESDYALMDANVKSANVAFSEKYLEQLCIKNNFRIVEISYGSWRDNKEAEDFQDYVILEKQ